MNRRVRQLWGFPSDVTREILGTRRSRESDAIVFNGPTNAPVSRPFVVPSDVRPVVVPSEFRPLIGPSNVRPVVVPSDHIIHFPKEENHFPKGQEHTPEHKDYDDIDLSGSFTLKPVTDAPTMPPFAPLAIHVQATFANCGSFTKDGVYVSTSSDSGVYIFPNGTQVAYSKCEVLQTLNPPG